MSASIKVEGDKHITRLDTETFIRGLTHVALSDDPRDLAKVLAGLCSLTNRFAYLVSRQENGEFSYNPEEIDDGKYVFEKIQEEDRVTFRARFAKKGEELPQEY